MQTIDSWAVVADTQELCTVVTRLVADTVAVHSVTIWLWQETAPGRVRCGGSTVFSEEQASAPGLTEEEMAELITYLRQHQGLVDFATPSDAPGKALRQRYADSLQRAHICYAIPLRAGQEFLGVMTLYERLHN